MISSETRIRVRYAETDRMGFVYYGNYAIYFEIARVEMLREIGINYKQLEDDGICLPVVEYSIKYIKPAFYDDQLIIKSKIEKLPSARIHFTYETFNNKEELINIAETTLVFVNIKSMKPCQMPDFVRKKMQSYFEVE